MLFSPALSQELAAGFDLTPGVMNLAHETCSVPGGPAPPRVAGNQTDAAVYAFLVPEQPGGLPPQHDVRAADRAHPSTPMSRSLRPRR